MSDHYSILGLTKSATHAEIKAAYRRLVKVYHPDKNPNNPEAVIRFRSIQEAYDVLSHSASKLRYDNGFSAAAYSYDSPFSKTAEKKQQGRTKKYTFTEEDLKRRQYYKEHYKQNTSKAKTHNEEHRKAYNEIKYILASVPIAIALLFFIINIYNRGKEDPAKVTATKKVAVSAEVDPVKPDSTVVEETVNTADEPYTGLFGSPKVDKRTLQVVDITNYANRDAIVCVVDSKTNKVVRHYFIADNFNLAIEYLPEGIYYMRNYLGKIGSFEKNRATMKGSSVGMFAENQQYQAFPKDTFSISLSRHDTIVKDILLIREDNRPSSAAGKKNLIDSTKFFGL